MPNEIHLDLRLQALSYLNGSTWMQQQPDHDVRINKRMDILSGTAVQQCDVVYARRRSLASGATDLLDLNGSTLKDVFGNNLNFITLCMCMIINEDTPNVDGSLPAPNTTNLTVGAGANQIQNILGSVGATKILRPGDVFLTANFGSVGIATISPGTNDELQIVNSAGATNNYIVVLAGRSV